jgi:hypothetical protein
MITTDEPLAAAARELGHRIRMRDDFVAEYVAQYGTQLD